MEITDTHNFAAPPEAVWAVLMDPDAIKACLGGVVGSVRSKLIALSPSARRFKQATAPPPGSY